MDDTVQTGAQAMEDALLARIEAGTSWMVTGSHRDAHGVEWVVQRVSRDAAEMGAAGGSALRHLWLTDLPAEAHGRVMLSFDGWADDPRALVEVPVVVDFLRGLVADPGSAWQVLQVLVDERTLAEALPDDWWNAAGRLWLVAHVLPGAPLWERDAHGLARDLAANVTCLDALLALEPPADA